MKNLLKLLIILLLPTYIFAHSLVLYVDDNKDGTITVFAEFNTGESATGAIIKLVALHSNEILFQKRLTDEDMILDIPKIPYKVVVDDGDEHSSEKIGIAPPNGFEKVEASQIKVQKEERKSRSLLEISSSKAVTVSIILAFILLFATLFISIKNTQKILNEIKKSR